MEEKITFPCGELLLEGLLNRRASEVGAIVTHPHPLYGGDMSNPVVESLVHSFNRRDISTLRFNFRGTGQSGGCHDGGIGEALDVHAAINLLLHKGITAIHLTGYSFGAWVLAHMLDLPAVVEAMIFVSPPLALLPFRGDVSQLPLLKLVITGEEDEIAPVHLVQKSLPQWNSNAHLAVIDHADHFYFGSFPALEETMHRHLTGSLV